MNLNKIRINKFAITLGIASLVGVGSGIYGASEKPDSKIAVLNFILGIYSGSSAINRARIQNNDYERLKRSVDKHGEDVRSLRLFVKGSPCDRSIAKEVLREKDNLDFYYQLCDSYPLRRWI